MNIWILILVTHVNSGSVVSFQEWTSQKKCEEAKTWAIAAAKSVGSSIQSEAICKER